MKTLLLILTVGNPVQFEYPDLASCTAALEQVRLRQNDNERYAEINAMQKPVALPPLYCVPLP
jgi:hypothetical protein